MFGLIKKCFYRISDFIDFNECKFVELYFNEQSTMQARPQIVNVNEDNPMFFPFSSKTSKCSGSCNYINNPHAKLCVPYVVKNLNVKVFNLMSRTNETRHIKWHKTGKCKCRFASVCNNKQL